MTEQRLKVAYIFQISRQVLDYTTGTCIWFGLFIRSKDVLAKLISLIRQYIMMYYSKFHILLSHHNLMYKSALFYFEEYVSFIVIQITKTILPSSMDAIVTAFCY